jgi:hypothetical protein
MAWFYRDYATDVPADKRPIYAQAEAEARAAKRGLWRDSNAIAPWDFRHPRSEAVSTAVLSSGRIIGNRNSSAIAVPHRE